MRILRDRCRVVCRPARRLESDPRFLAGLFHAISPRAEVPSRPGPQSWNGSGTVARAGGRGAQVLARAKTRELVLRTPWQKSFEELAAPAGFPQSRRLRLPRSGDGK